MSDFIFTVGEPTYNWNTLFASVLDLGTFNITNNTPQTSLTLTIGTTQLVINGTGLQADASRHLTAGSIVSVVLTSNGQEVVRAQNFAAPHSFAELQALLTEYDKPVPDPLVISAALAQFALMEPANVTGSNDRDVFQTSIVGGDVVNLNGGNDAYIILRPATAVTVDGGSGNDFLQIESGGNSGVNFNFGTGEVRVNDTYDLLASFTSFEAGRGSQYADTFLGSNNEDDSLFIEASLGYDQYYLGGESYVRLSYRNFFQQTGIAGGINVNLSTQTITKAGAGGVDRVNGADTIQGTDYTDTFYGSVWRDEFEGMDGADSFNGSGGNDRVNYSVEFGTRGVFVNLSDTSSSGAVTGTSTIVVAAHTARDSYGNLETLTSIEDIVGTDVNDRIVGDSKDNIFWGEAGLDRLYGNGGDDELHGGDGNDYLYGGDGNDDLYGGASNDTINGDEGNDHINGGEGNDTINAGGGDFDNIEGSGGSDTVDGANGYDMYAFDEFDRGEDANGDGNPGNQNEHAGDTIAVTLEFGEGAGKITGYFGLNSTKPAPTRLAVNQTFTNLERIRGTEGNDTFNMGVAFANSLYASTLTGDERFPDTGVFELVGGKGNDTFTDNYFTRAVIVNYHEERWSHPDFNGDNDYRWGDGGELGVAVNLSATNKNIAGFGVVTAGRARDTWSNTDTLTGILAVRLTDAADVFYASDDGVWALAEGGDDRFFGGTGIDVFIGGRGNDIGSGGNGNDYLNGQDGDDTLSGGNGHDEIQGGNGKDILSGEGGRDQISGGDDDDIINGGDHADFLNGDNGNDTIHGDASNDDISGGDGNDQLFGDDGYDEVYGDDGNDTIEGNAGDDRLRGGSGLDIVIGGLGDDRIDGDDDDDTLYGDDIASADLLGGNDRINGGQGNDTIRGGHGHDDLQGDDGEDVIRGGFGDDHINGGADNDLLYGEDGEDDIYGDSGNDTIFGDNGDDSVNGAEGTDVLYGGAGNDDLYGGDGEYDDILEGGTGSDNLGGGLGNDIYVLGNEAQDADMIWEMGGVDLVTSTITRSIANLGGQIENLTLIGADAIDGVGNWMDNVLRGNENTNTLQGGDGGDTLYGNGGADTLLGEFGNDFIIGGLGRDVMTGGDGDDTFDYNLSTETGKTIPTRDLITDFSQAVGNRDIIDLFDVDAVSNVGGNQTFSFVALKGGAFAGAGSLIWTQQNPAGTVNDKTLVMGDVNGDGVADFHIELTGLIDLTVADFIL